MIKIKYSKEVEQKHLKYFEEMIVPRFKVDSDIPKRLEDILRYFQEPYSKRKVWEIIAIGKPEELKIIYEKIKGRFPGIIKSLGVRKNSAYKDHLNKIFGYDDFCNGDVFDCLNETAMKELGLGRYNDKVRDRIVDILLNEFPDHAEEIEDLRCANDRVMFKEKLGKLEFVSFTQFNIGKARIFDGCWNAYIFSLMSKVNVCPYCNRQYISPVYSDDGKVRGDIDHFLPKSIYPYFSMSLYNLIPTCKSCNQSLKRDKTFDFDSINPFVEDIDDHFSFEADLETDKITLKPSPKKNGNIMEHTRVFKLEPLYNYHQNQVIELKMKRVIYPNSYIAELQEKHKKFFPQKDQLIKLIIGVTNEKEDLNKEAFHKLRKDISKQLNFFNGQDDHLINELKKVLERQM